MKNIYVLLFVIFGFTNTILGQEELTDVQLSFDRTHYTNIYAQEGLSTSEIELQIEKIRTYYVKRYSSQGSNTSLIIPVSLQTSCNNMGFEDNSFNGWCRRTGVFDGYTVNDGYVIIYDDVDDVSQVICDNSVIDDTSCGGTNEPATAPRFSIQPQVNQTDNYGIDLASIEGSYALKLGNDCDGSNLERIEQSFIVNNTNSVFDYRFALVFEDTGTCSHIDYENTCDSNNPVNLGNVLEHDKPYFSVFLEFQGQKIECSEYLIFGDDNLFDFDPGNGNTLIKDWSNNIINLLDYVNVGDEVKVVAEVADCALGAHFGYAYFEASCGNDALEISASTTNVCIDDTVTFNASATYTDYFWSFFDNNGALITTLTGTQVQFSYSQPGYYKVTYGPPNTGTTEVNCSQSIYVDVEDCGLTGDACDDCYSFKPNTGDKYWLSAWVKEEHPNQVISYSDTFLQVTFSNGSNNIIGIPVEFYPTGDIIEGWQRIVGAFKVPLQTIYFNLNLMNTGGYPAYFDDVRVHPFNGNMKSFVYDNENYRLMAELDENNFATFYEYDNEGGLVRIKKETEKGIMTIQETRSSTTKKTN